MKRRTLLGTAAAAAAATTTAASAAGAAARAGERAPRTLRVAFRSAEAGFDPPRVGDQPSIRVIAHIFEPLLGYDVLARPAVTVPRTAARLPEVAADFKRMVFTLRPGIFFADDPVFQGKPRELIAADYVYSIKRFFDPAIRTEHLYQFENLKLIGLSELRQQAIKAKTPFPYDVEVPGLRVLDRYRLEVLMAEPQPRAFHAFTYWFSGAVAREVVEAYAADPMAHPVGTGPFRLAQWRRASRIVLERNPRYRSEPFTTVGAGRWWTGSRSTSSKRASRAGWRSWAANTTRSKCRPISRAWRCRAAGSHPSWPARACRCRAWLRRTSATPSATSTTR
jgi:ABC-type transport system substrate-binding protein